MHLSPLTTEAPEGSAIATPALSQMSRSRPVVGKLRNITIEFTHTAGSSGLTAAQKAGLRYEAKAQLHLRELLTDYCPSPIFYFIDDNGSRKCVPDGIYLPRKFGDPIFVFEIKTQHMPEAWFQLRKLYEPVVRAKFPLSPVGCIEVCRSFDPEMQFPEKPVLLDDIQQAVRRETRSLGVYVWRP